jgi:hypothetical protein
MMLRRLMLRARGESAAKSAKTARVSCDVTFVTARIALFDAISIFSSESTKSFVK